MAKIQMSQTVFNLFPSWKDKIERHIRISQTQYSRNQDHNNYVMKDDKTNKRMYVKQLQKKLGC